MKAIFTWSVSLLSAIVLAICASACATENSTLNDDGIPDMPRTENLTSKYGPQKNYKYSIVAKSFRDLAVAPRNANRIAFFDRRNLNVINLEDGSSLYKKTLDTPVILDRLITFSPSGNKLAFTDSMRNPKESNYSRCVFILNLANANESSKDWKCIVLDHHKNPLNQAQKVGGVIKRLEWSQDESFVMAVSQIFGNTHDLPSYTVLTTLHLASGKSQTLFDKKSVEIGDFGFNYDKSKLYVITAKTKSRWHDRELWMVPVQSETFGTPEKISVNLFKNYRSLGEIWVPQIENAEQIALGGMGDAAKFDFQDASLQYTALQPGQAGGGGPDELLIINGGKNAIDLRNKGLWTAASDGKVSYFPQSKAAEAGVSFFETNYIYGSTHLSEPLSVVDTFGISKSVEISPAIIKHAGFYGARFDSDHGRWLLIESKSNNEEQYLHVYDLLTGG